jgi:hypothetical protein
MCDFLLIIKIILFATHPLERLKRKDGNKCLAKTMEKQNVHTKLEAVGIGTITLENLW